MEIAMKKLLLSVLLWTVGLATLTSGVLHAQNITGTWQGPLKVPQRDLRTVIKISLEDDRLKAVMYSIDQGGQPVPASAISRDGAAVKMAVTAIRLRYPPSSRAGRRSVFRFW
jgi:hypothetical protein